MNATHPMKEVHILPEKSKGEGGSNVEQGQNPDEEGEEESDVVNFLSPMKLYHLNIRRPLGLSCPSMGERCWLKTAYAWIR